MMSFFGNRRLQIAGLVLLVAGLTSWNLSTGGIIELGRKGQKKKSSVFEITVGVVTVADTGSDPNTDAYVILEGLGDQLRDRGFTVVTVDPNPLSPLNALSITDGFNEPTKLRVFVDDDPSGIFGGASRVITGTLAPHQGPPVYVLQGLDTVAGDGTVTIDVTLESGPLAPILLSTNVSGATPEDKAREVNRQIIVQLVNRGLNVTPPASQATAKAQITVRSPHSRIIGLGIKSDDTGVKEYRVIHQPGRGRAGIPALSTWGLILLMLGLAGAAVLLLRRRQAPLRPAP